MGHRVSCPEVVGRETELRELLGAFDAAVAGEAGTVLVEGDAGIGKTRLVDELCRRVRDRGALTAKGVCVPVTDGGLPYGPVAGIRRELARALGDAAPQLLGPLADDLPAVGGRAQSKVSHQHKRILDEVAKTNLFESILSVLTTLAERSPLVIVFDDLQWADSASAELLSFLTRNLDNVRVLLVGTIRTDEVGSDHALRPWLAEISRHNRVTRLPLAGLGRDDVQVLISGILGHEPDWTLAEAVWARSQGNPFFAEELTAAGPVSSLPPELTRVIMTRVETLSKKAQQLLRIASIVGMDVEHNVLAAVADGFDADALDAAVSEAVDSQVLVLDDARTGYRFRHALLREALDASLLPGERVRLHRRVAESLTADGRGRSRPAELAVHWWAAEAWAEAHATSLEAADAALALWGFPEAQAHLERALAACDRMPPDSQPSAADRLALLDRAVDAAYLAGDSARSVELAQAAVDATDAEADPAGAARRYAILGRNCWGLSDSVAATDAYRRGVAVMPESSPTKEL
ncbi:MAG: AAA family ATPase, partial [Actinobacteria bacterium]|nr:AAA family ATPase [Actinomycetota bacterium]